MSKIIFKSFRDFERHHIILLLILFSIVIFRFPSLYEPFWYGDEGIFAAVARNLNLGGVLYQTAWDNKPPMIYLTYQMIFKIFGVSMYWLRFIALVSVLATAVAIYEIALKIMDKKRALWASFIFGVLTSLRLIEGNLALTEIFMILPITCAVLFAILRKFDYISIFIAGLLFAIASLYKQVGALEAAAFGIFLFLNEKKFLEFFKKGLILSLGFLIPYLATIAYFFPKGLVDDWVFAAYTYYSIYFEESPRYAALINVSKFMPPIVVIFYGIFKKYRAKSIDIFHLFLLWCAFSFLGSYFSGRTYGHYLVQSIPAFALLIASISISKFNLTRARVIFSIAFFLPLIFLTRLIFSDFISGGPINQIRYYRNFIDFAAGSKGVNSYNDFFDNNVNTIMALSDSLKLHGGFAQSMYIWGDYPWLYAITDAQNPSRYVTSFHVFGVPDGRQEVTKSLNANPPLYIVKPQNSIGYFDGLEKLISSSYTFVAKINGAEVYSRNSEE